MQAYVHEYSHIYSMTIYKRCCIHEIKKSCTFEE